MARYYRLRPDCVVRVQDVKIITILPVEHKSPVGKREAFVVAMTFGPGESVFSEAFPTHAEALVHFERMIRGEFTMELKT